jgi:formate-dependent nitrite reductase cytochrome c552 subunit
MLNPRAVTMPPLRELVILFLPFACGCGEHAQASPARTTEGEPAISPPALPSKHAVVIHEPPKLTSIETHETDATGRPLRVACVTCHTLRAPSPLPTQPSSLRQFHEGLTFEHGSLACASCHDPQHPQSLHLADGTGTGMPSVMRLCSQCHGPQRRDYDHGAHGGMNGYWDLSRGPRLRNNCVDCHDPHAPKFAVASPVLPPRDRLLETSPGLETRHE